MSHVYTYETEITDLETLKKVLGSLGVKIQIEKCSTLLFNSRVEGIAMFQLPGWHYPCVITEEGKLKYDNFRSMPNSMDTLHRLIQNYYAEGIVSNIDWTKVQQTSQVEMQNGDIQIELLYGT